MLNANKKNIEKMNTKFFLFELPTSSSSQKRETATTNHYHQQTFAESEKKG